jgi:hypothetical protein
MRQTPLYVKGFYQKLDIVKRTERMVIPVRNMSANNRVKLGQDFRGFWRSDAVAAIYCAE